MGDVPVRTLAVFNRIAQACSGVLLVGVSAAFLIPRAFQRSSTHINRTKADVAQLSQLLDTFRRDTGRYPSLSEGLLALGVKHSGLRGWKGPYINRLPNDKWGRPYVYGLDEKGPIVASFGPDRISGGDGDDADISNRDN